MASNPFAQARAERRTLLMGWATLGSPYVIELMGEAGLGAVLIDQQHGIGGSDDLVNCLVAARAAGLPALVRPRAIDAGLIGQALDAGAHGVLCPMVCTAGDAERIVQACKYPPRGRRSWGPYRGKFLADEEYFAASGALTVAGAQIETREALDALDSILAVDGLDLVLVGPNDLAIALTGERDIRRPEVVEAIALVLDKCREHAVIPAIFANDIDYARPLVKAGWTVVTVSSDAGLLSGALKSVAAAVAGDRS
ncbi:MAG: HpcH/HpaI aldolase/citrate lyase family protein [Hyphomicrobiales bacterium]